MSAHYVQYFPHFMAVPKIESLIRFHLLCVNPWSQNILSAGLNQLITLFGNFGTSMHGFPLLLSLQRFDYA